MQTNFGGRKITRQQKKCAKGRASCRNTAKLSDNGSSVSASVPSASLCEAHIWISPSCAGIFSSHIIRSRRSNNNFQQEDRNEGIVERKLLFRLRAFKNASNKHSSFEFPLGCCRFPRRRAFESNGKMRTIDTKVTCFVRFDALFAHVPGRHKWAARAKSFHCLRLRSSESRIHHVRMFANIPFDEALQVENVY